MDRLDLVQDGAMREEAAERRHRRFGLRLFVAYLLVYAGFIGIAAFQHATFSSRSILGLNVAVVYGFGLIGLAFALALVFLFAGSKSCPTTDSSKNQGNG